MGLGAYVARTSLLLLLGAALGVMPTTANAGSIDRPDPRGDVSKLDQEGLTVTRAAGRTNGDIIRTVFRHEQKNVRIQIHFADLRQSFGESTIGTPLVTNEGVRREVIVNIRQEGSGWTGTSTMWPPGDEAGPVNCPIQHSVDYGNNLVNIDFPSTCISNPRWLRVGAEIRIWSSGPVSLFVYQDNALEEGPNTKRAPLKRGPLSPPLPSTGR